MKWIKRIILTVVASVLLVAWVNQYLEKERIKNEVYMTIYGYEYDDTLEEWVKKDAYKVKHKE